MDIVDKNGFEQGDENSFKELIREKCPSVKKNFK